MRSRPRGHSLFFFNHPATTEIYTLSLHDALPISVGERAAEERMAADDADAPGYSDARGPGTVFRPACFQHVRADRKSTRLNSSHVAISYAVFCLKKKKYNSTSRQHPFTEANLNNW